MRSDARFYSEACEKRHRRSLSTDKAPTLDEVRAQHEESKGRWTVIVREHLNRTLLQTGFISAEDFDALGVPDEHRNLANAQMGGYSSKGYIEPVSWRRSTKASRKSGKIWTHRLTDLGREKLAGVGAGGLMPQGSGMVSTGTSLTVSADPGDPSAHHLGDPSSKETEGVHKPAPDRFAEVDQEGSGDGQSAPEPEVLSLFPEVDREAWAA
jgi:hypothetical protein